MLIASGYTAIVLPLRYGYARGPPGLTFQVLDVASDVLLAGSEHVLLDPRQLPTACLMSRRK